MKNLLRINGLVFPARFPKVYEERDFPDTVHPMHYSFHDLTGDSVVLEYTKDGGRKTFENTIGLVQLLWLNL